MQTETCECEFYEISKNTFFTERLWATASVVCSSETWADDNKKETDSLIQLSGYNVLHKKES